MDRGVRQLPSRQLLPVIEMRQRHARFPGRVGADPQERAAELHALDERELVPRIVRGWVGPFRVPELQLAIRDRFPATKVLVMSMHDDLMYGERAIKAGAGGYVMKEVASMRLVEAIRTIMAGELYVSEKLQKRLMSKLLKGGGDPGAIAMDILSDREFEVFQLIGNGFSTKEIAEKLNVSANTVESHRNRIKAKLNLESSAELSRHAIQWVISQKQNNP